MPELYDDNKEVLCPCCGTLARIPERGPCIVVCASCGVHYVTNYATLYGDAEGYRRVHGWRMNDARTV